MEGNAGLSCRRKRKYCCMCNNYRGQVVSGRKVTLHRFPLDENKRKTWIDVCQNALESFQYSANRLLCSEHFVDGNVPTKGPTKGQHPCPVFGERFTKQMLKKRQDVFSGSRRCEPNPSNMFSCNSGGAEDEHSDHNYACSYVLRCMNEEASGNYGQTSERWNDHCVGHKMTKYDMTDHDFHGDVSINEISSIKEGSGGEETGRGSSGNDCTNLAGSDNVNDHLTSPAGSRSVNTDLTSLTGTPGSRNMNTDHTSLTGTPGSRNVNTDFTSLNGKPGSRNVNADHTSPAGSRSVNTDHTSPAGSRNVNTDLTSPAGRPGSRNVNTDFTSLNGKPGSRNVNTDHTSTAGSRNVNTDHTSPAGSRNVNTDLTSPAGRPGSRNVNTDFTSLTGMPGSRNVNSDHTSPAGSRSVNTDLTSPAGMPGSRNVNTDHTSPVGSRSVNTYLTSPAGRPGSRNVNTDFTSLNGKPGSRNVNTDHTSPAGSRNVNTDHTSPAGSRNVNTDLTSLAGTPGSRNVNTDHTSPAGKPGSRNVNTDHTSPAGTPGSQIVTDGFISATRSKAVNKDLLSSVKDRMTKSHHTNSPLVHPIRAVLGYSGVNHRKTEPSLAHTVMRHMESAVQKVRNGEGDVDDVAREFGLPPSLLHDYLNGTCSYQVLSTNCTVQPGLFDFEEQSVVQFLQYMDCCGFPISIKLVNSAVLTVIRRSGLLNRSKISSDKGPMERWCRSFLQRHCSNLLGKITSMDGKQRWQIAEKQMERYIHLLNFMIQEHGLGDSPGQIYNCGELRLAGEIVVRNRLRSRYKHAPRIAAHSTQYMCVSASGRILLPFIVLPKLSETAIAESSCKNWVLETSFDSTMNEELFRKWFKKVFLPHCSYETKNKPVLIIMDNSSSVLTPDIVELAILNNVHFLYSPEQLKSKLQPLGYNIFDLLKQRMIDEIRRRHPSCEDIRACRCSQEDIPSVFGTAASLISATDIQTAFCETGIYPFNYDFLSSLAPANTSVYVYRVQDIVTMGTQQASHVNTLLGGAQTNAALEEPAVSRARTAGGSGTKTEENDSIKKEGEENMKTVGGASDVSDTEGGGCPLCGVLYSDREDWIACDQCDRWVCQQCSGVSLAAWRAVSQTKAQWICHSCTA